jgi:hypothetical protein
MMLPVGDDVLNHPSTENVSGFVYCFVVSAHPVEPSVVMDWVPSGPAVWYVSPFSANAVSGAVPPQFVEVSPSDSWATPQVPARTDAEDADVVPGDPRTVVADDDAVVERDPVGRGEPLTHVVELVLTEPPVPVPVE